MSPRLVFVRQAYTPFGGAERFLASVMERLEREGVELEILCRRWKANGGPRHALVDPPYVGRLWRDAGFSHAACAWIGRQSDIRVQSHERIPCCDIYRAGDGVHREWLAQRARLRGGAGRLLQGLSPYHRYTLAAERRLFTHPRLRRVICNSAMVRDEILRHYPVSPELLRIIPNGVDCERFHPGLRRELGPQTRRRFGIPVEAVVLTIVGSGYQRKGVDQLIRALPETPAQTHLLVVGKDRKPAHYQRLAHRLGVASRVHIAGPQDDPRPFYAAADVYAHPALYDPAPSAVLEAMACGLPVVASEKTGNSDIIRSQRAGNVCDALDRAGLLAAIAGLLDPRQRAEQGDNARRAAETSFSLPQMTDAYLTFYREMLHADPHA